MFQNFLKLKSIHHYSRFTDKGPSIAEKIIRTVRNLLKKLIFSAGISDWLSKLPSVIKQHNNTIHISIKMSLNQSSEKSNEKKVYSNLQDRRDKQQPKFNVGHLVRKADIKRVFSKGDRTNYCFKLYKITEVIHDTILSYRFNYLPDKNKEKLLLPTKLPLDENNQIMTDLNLIQ